MKKALKNSTKLLIFLYGAGLADQPTVDYQLVHLLFPQLTNSGRRSLVSYLKKNHYLLVEEIDNAKQLFLTSHGKAYLEAEFPSFSSGMKQWNGQWAMMLFLEGPKADPHFRYLRQLLVDTNAGQLSRGVYVYPKRFHQQVENQYEYYRNAISVVTIQKWQFGDERAIMVPLFQLSDVKDSLSGVSKEVDELLGVSDKEKGSMLRKEEDIALVFDRLTTVISFDIGIHHHYFPQVQSVLEILTRFCKTVLL